MTNSPRTEIELYQHNETDFALLLSKSGKASDAQWVPKSLVTEPADTRLLKVDDVAVERGLFHVEGWKLRELDWLTDESDERQGSLFG